VVAFAVNDIERHLADMAGHKYQERYRYREPNGAENRVSAEVSYMEVAFLTDTLFVILANEAM